MVAILSKPKSLIGFVVFLVKAWFCFLISLFEFVKERIRGSRSPFLEGNFGPVREEIQADELQVIGELPEGLNGFFVRNGPNPKQTIKQGYHWFDGDGMLHGVEIKNGVASYRNRWVRTDRFIEEEAAGCEVHRKLGGLLSPRAFVEVIYGKLKHLFESKILKKTFKGVGTANTSVVFTNDDKLLALVENDVPYHIDVPTLETIGKFDFEGKYKGSFTAHPKLDAKTGEMFTFGYSLENKPPHVNYSVIDSQGQLVGTCPISLPVNVMMHDCAITEKYAIIFDLPLAFRPERTLLRKPALAFEGDRPARFGIFPRETVKDIDSIIRWFEVPACFIFHSVNAWEEGDEVVLYACRAASQRMDLRSLVLDTFPYVTEWRFNLATGAVSEKKISNLAGEFPRVRDDLIGYQSRYAYWALFPENASPQDLPKMDGVCKWDLEKQQLIDVCRYGPKKYAGECLFAPSSKGDKEDDGWLLTYVTDESTAEISTEFWVIDAKTMKNVARVKIPQRVPYGFHGAWNGAKAQ